MAAEVEVEVEMVASFSSELELWIRMWQLQCSSCKPGTNKYVAFGAPRPHAMCNRFTIFFCGVCMCLLCLRSWKRRCGSSKLK